MTPQIVRCGTAAAYACRHTPVTKFQDILQWHVPVWDPFETMSGLPSGALPALTPGTGGAEDRYSFNSRSNHGSRST